MAIKLNAAYSKKLGLPNFSSHSFAASVEVELTDPGTIAAETARLYGILQTSVDNEIRQTGYLPNPEAPTRPVNGNGAWQCSDKQRRLLTDLTRELQLSEEELIGISFLIPSALTLRSCRPAGYLPLVGSSHRRSGVGGGSDRYQFVLFP